MRVPPRAYRWLVAGVLGTSMAVAADVRADATWRIALHEGEREGLTATPERLELGPAAEPSSLYHFTREGRYLSAEMPLEAPPVEYTRQLLVGPTPDVARLAARPAAGAGCLRARLQRRTRPIRPAA